MATACRDHALSVCNMPSVRDGGEVSATSLHTLIQMVDGGLGRLPHSAQLPLMPVSVMGSI